MRARRFRLGAALLLVSAAAWLTITNLNEAFGSGPPYYSRTTNMDKWENPLPFVVALDLTAIVIAGALLLPVRRDRNAQRD